MNAGGWILMIVSVTSVITFFGWCLTKVLSTPGSTEHIHSQADIEPPDAKRND
jgi:hypothetical protein